MRKAIRPKTTPLLLAILAILGLCAFTSQRPTTGFRTRHIPLRWIELHASRHPECQHPDGGSFRSALPTIHPSTWTSSERAHWIVSRMNTVYSGTGIQFWLKSHEVDCTDQVARFLTDGSGKAVPEQLNTPFLGSEVVGDIRLLFPHANLSDLGPSDSLRRERWLQKAVALFDDPRGMPILFHSDYENAVGSPFLPYEDTDGLGNDFVLPQHGYAPWDSPGLAFMFLSAITWADLWRFDPELTLAHEIGHALGNPHTLDFDIFAIGQGVFPDGSSYGWPDFWDLAYVRTASGATGFASRRQAKKWVDAHYASNPTDIRRIDDRWNVVLDKSDGRMSVQLNHDPALTTWSETLVPTVVSGQVRLLQGLSFDLAYDGGQPPHAYAWQRNLMSYRYPDHFYPQNPVLPGDSVDPYDHLTARFSQSQIEIMQRQLKGSTKFTATDYGTIPPGKESYFASRFDVLGDGKREAFVWYSNGEGPDAVDPSDDKADMVAFRLAPANRPLLFAKPDKVRPLKMDTSPQRLIAGDFNGDALTDVLWYGGAADGQRQLLWSRTQEGVHQWDTDPISEGTSVAEGYAPVLAGDFDGNGADDLLFSRRGTETKIVVHFDNNPRCRSYQSCRARSAQVELGAFRGPTAVGNLDGQNGDDLAWVEYARGATYAHLAWSTADGSLIDGGKHMVGSGKYVPYIGNFNGTGGDDVLWHSPRGNEVIWWGGAERGAEYSMACGPGGSWECVAASSDIVQVPWMTIGDFDGNGADDLMIRDSHEPTILFSTKGTQLEYQGSYVPIKVALRDSAKYLTLVGEFDDAASGDRRLGDDILLLPLGK